MKINYLEAVEGGSVTAEAIVVRIGRHVAVVDCDVTDDAPPLGRQGSDDFFCGTVPEEPQKTARVDAHKQRLRRPVRARSHNFSYHSQTVIRPSRQAR